MQCLEENNRILVFWFCQNWQVLDTQPYWQYTGQQVQCPLQQTALGQYRPSLLCHDPVSVFTLSHRPVQAGSLSAFHNCSLTSVGRVLKRSSSTTRPVLFSCRQSPSSTGRHSRRFPLSSSCVSPVSSPNRDGRDCRQLFPKFKVRSFLHWKSSFGRLSIFFFFFLKVAEEEVMGEKKTRDKKLQLKIHSAVGKLQQANQSNTMC